MGEQEVYRKPKLFKEPVNNIIHWEIQHRGSSLKSAWAIREGHLLTDFKGQRFIETFSRNGSAGRYRFSCTPSAYLVLSWQAPVLKLSIYSGSCAHPAPCSLGDPPYST